MLGLLLGFGLLVGCATGTKPDAAIGDDDDDGVSIDAPSSPADARQVAPDAPVTPVDAPVMPDAFVPQDAPAMPPDAASPFCTSNNECTVAGQCCIRLGGPVGFCGDGIPFGGECIPQ